MDELDSRLLKEVYEIINLANFTLDRDLLRRKIMDALFNRIYIENSVFFLPDENEKSKGGIEINIDEKYVKQYKDYYHHYDPIQLIRGPFIKKNVVQLEELIDYSSFISSKFYCEFLRPQSIHHKLYINLCAANKYQGRIALYRPVRAKKFSREDIHILKAISPYLAHALDHNELFINLKLKDSILQIMDKNWSTGLILLDDSMHLVYMNQKAKEFCSALLGKGSCQDMYIHVPRMLLKDCYAMMEELKRCPADCLVLPKHKVMRMKHSGKFHLCSRILEKGAGLENYRLYMISIDELNARETIDQDILKIKYRLTERELDIIRHLFKGLRNAEIAQRLFVSEITIKKHIQHIFTKVGVKNRTTLIHRILDKKYHFS